MRRRGGSLIRATSLGTAGKHCGSPRSGPRQQNRRGISTPPCRSLCPSPRHLLHPSPLRQLPHRQRHYRHRLHEHRTPRLRPCIARCVTGLRPSLWYTIGPCGYGVSAGERRSNQRDCSPACRLQGLAGSADRTCIGFPVFEDNQGALQISKNSVSSSNSKYINVRHHFLRELVRQGDIIVNHVPSEYQQADTLTKVLAFDLFAIHRRFLTNLSD